MENKERDIDWIAAVFIQMQKSAHDFSSGKYILRRLGYYIDFNTAFDEFEKKVGSRRYNDDELCRKYAPRIIFKVIKNR